MPDKILLMAVRAELKPDARALMQRIQAWIRTHLEAPLAQVLDEYIAHGGGHVNVVDAAEPHIAQCLKMARCASGSDDPLRLEGVRWCIIVGAQGVMVPPVMHVWFARIAAHVLHAHFDEPVTDAVTLLIDENYPDVQTVLAAQGDIHMRRHLRVLASHAEPNMVCLTSVGLRDFGLPELQVASCPTALAGAMQVVVAGTAQHLLNAAMGKMSRLDESAAQDVQMLELPEVFSLTGAMLDAAMGARARGNVAALVLRLRFMAGDAGNFAVVQIKTLNENEAPEDGGWQSALDTLLAGRSAQVVEHARAG